MHRYATMIAGTACKFYSVSVEGTSWTARWGRMGSAGQSKTTECYTEQAAQIEADEQFRTKLKKGYTEKEPLQILASALEIDREVPAVLSPKELEAPPDLHPALGVACAKLNRVIADKDRVARKVLDDQATSVLESFAAAARRTGASPAVVGPVLKRLRAALYRHGREPDWVAA